MTDPHMLGFGRKRQPSLMRKEHWQAFVEAPLEGAETRFGPRAAWAKLARRDRLAFDALRADHHSSFVIETPRMRELHDHLWNQARANYGAVGARPGSVIDAVSGGYGKTWTMVHFGRAYERVVREFSPQHPPGVGEVLESIPVVYIALRANTAPTAIDEDILTFFGRPVDDRTRRKDLARIVEEVAWDCGTSLVLVDDIQNLRSWQKNDAAISRHLNHLASRVSATFIYAGIDCEGSGVFDEGESPFGRDAANTSTQCRFTHLVIEPFSFGVQWQALLRGFEEQFVLLKRSEGMLCVDLAEYLHERTGGVIGSTSQLLRRAADLAITTGEEKITERLLQSKSLIIDRAAEKRASKATKQRRAKAAVL